MKIREINALRGPNYWSARRHKLIVMVLDLEEMEKYPSNKVDGFNDRLKKLLPSMYSHRCSVGEPGGFFQRLDDGTWMGHIIEHIALEIQTLAGMDTGFGRTRGYGGYGVYSVVFSYIEESVGRYAAEAAVRICEALIAGNAYNLEEDIQRMRELREDECLGPSTSSIIEEAENRGIPWIRLSEGSLCQLGYGGNQKRIQATVTSETSSIGVELACNKEETKHLLDQARIPVPDGDIISIESELKESCQRLGYPIVIKPINGNHGRGVTVNIKDGDSALLAFRKAKTISNEVVIENYIKGDDFRILIINHKYVAAAKRTSAQVVGDGELTIAQLVEKENQNPNRGFGHEKILTRIDIDKSTKLLLGAKGYTEETIPKNGEVVRLKHTANISTGGTAEDVTDIVHPANISMAERISKIIGLDICGIDLMATDISHPISKTGGSVIEVNAGPGFRMHLAPTKGVARNVAEPVVDKLFPKKGDTGRIPIIAITGTNGKTTTSRLIAHMAKIKGFRVGYTTSDGVYIQNRLLMEGDCTGPKSAEFVLKDPTVNFAVLECARGGMLRAGLSFKHCDVGIVTNVSADHLGLKGINSIEQLARVKSIVPETVLPDGYAILNADDDLVFNMRKSLRCNIALFSMDEKNPRIKAMQKLGGITAVYENGYVTIFKGPWKMRIMKAAEIPLTFGGKATFMIQNVLGAILAANVRGFSIEDTKMALRTFIPSATQNPGRLNMFKFKDYSVLVDFAHNPPSMRALQKFVSQIEAETMVGVIGGTGDRREEDITEIGSIAADTFDEIIIRQDENLRGRTEKEIVGLITKGIVKKDFKKPIKVISSELEAITYVLKNAQKGSLIVICSDNIPKALDLVMEFKEKDEESGVLSV